MFVSEEEGTDSRGGMGGLHHLRFSGGTDTFDTYFAPISTQKSKPNLK